MSLCCWDENDQWIGCGRRRNSQVDSSSCAIRFGESEPISAGHWRAWEKMLTVSRKTILGRGRNLLTTKELRASLCAKMDLDLLHVLPKFSIDPARIRSYAFRQVLRSR